MRYLPDSQYEGFPCSYVAAGCAYEAVTGRPFPEQMPGSYSAAGVFNGKYRKMYCLRIWAFPVCGQRRLLVIFRE